MRITLTILLASLLVPNTGKTAALTGDRPNILFIIADDQSPFDLKVYNPRSELQTPNIDRLAATGMVFDGAHHMGSWVGRRVHGLAPHDHERPHRVAHPG